MGGDGGTTACERKYLRSAKVHEKQELARVTEQAAARWSICTLSSQPLKPPIVCCRLGNLYNKMAVIEALTDTEIKMDRRFKHIKGLKSLTTLDFTANPNVDKEKTTADSLSYTKEEIRADYICPITRLAVNGRNSFSTIFNGGGKSVVLATRCFKEMTAEDLESVVGYKFEQEHLLKLNPSKEEQKVLRDQLKADRKAARRKKREKSESKPRLLAGSDAKSPKKQEPQASSTRVESVEVHGTAPKSQMSSTTNVPIGSRAMAMSKILFDKGSQKYPHKRERNQGGEQVRKEKKKKSKKSKKTKRRRVSAREAALIREPTKIDMVSATYTTVDSSAQESVENRKKSDRVYDSIFSKGEENLLKGKNSGNNLFIRVATHRFTI